MYEKEYKYHKIKAINVQEQFDKKFYMKFFATCKQNVSSKYLYLLK